MFLKTKNAYIFWDKKEMCGLPKASSVYLVNEETPYSYLCCCDNPFCCIMAYVTDSFLMNYAKLK